MPFNPGIPAPTHTLAADQPLITQNFTEIANDFGRNHVSFVDPTPGNRGKHNLVTLRRQAVDQVSTIDESVLYTKFNPQDSSISAPYFAGKAVPFIFNVPLAFQSDHKNLPAHTVTVVYDFLATNTPPMVGTVLLYDNTNPTRTLFSPFFWSGAIAYTPGTNPNYNGQVASGADLVGFEDFANTTIGVHNTSGTNHPDCNLVFIGVIL
jgi:hypothetical protein